MNILVDHLHIDSALAEVVEQDLLEGALAEALAGLSETESGSYRLGHFEIVIPDMLSMAQIRVQLPDIIRHSFVQRLAYERDCGRRRI